MHIEAIVIRKRPVREHDQLVVLYSAQLGKFVAAAKGSLRRHSRQALSLDEGNVVVCELVSGKAGPILTGAQTVRAHSDAKHSAVRWPAASFFLQVADAVVYDEQPDARLWSCLNDILLQFDLCSDSAAIGVYRRSQASLLDVLGYGAQSAHDVGEGSLARGPLDTKFEEIAQRRLSAIDLFYDMAVRSSS